jgi:hypothetical protein
MESKVHELRIIVCGSSQFQDADFAFRLFDSVQRMLEHGSLRVGTVISGEFDGIDKLARRWAETNGVRHETMQWTMADEVSHSFFDREMPEQVLMRHPAFKQCAQAIQRAQVDAMALFPSADGRLGCTARNLRLVAGALELDTFSADEILASIKQSMGVAAKSAPEQQERLVEAHAQQAARAKPRF